MCIRHHTNCSVESVTERGTVTYNIDHMCIRHQTNCSVESVTERGAHIFSVWKRSSSCRNFNNTRVCVSHSWHVGVSCSVVILLIIIQFGRIGVGHPEIQETGVLRKFLQTLEFSLTDFPPDSSEIVLVFFPFTPSPGLLLPPRLPSYTSPSFLGLKKNLEKNKK